MHNLTRFASSAHLKSAQIQMQSNGVFPQIFSGGRAVVFPVKVQESTYALKCWIQKLGDLAVRYKRIHEFSSRHNPSFMLKSSYLENELLVNGIRYPVLMMEWSDSLTLKDWINHNISNSSSLLMLAQSFIKMTREMHALCFSHGDLQHENILVDTNMNLILVDYDSAFIPGLEHLRDEIKGLPGFQHKSRLELECCSPITDYFSEYIIYLSLYCLAKKPYLWEDAKNHNRLLFSDDDIKFPNNSIIVREIQAIPDLEKVLNAFLQNCACKSLDKMTPIHKALEVISTSSVSSQKKRPGSTRPTGVPTHMLTGSELLAKIKELGDASKSELVRSCGYVSTKRDGGERLNFTAFYEALLEAKSYSLDETDSAGRSQSNSNSQAVIPTDLKSFDSWKPSASSTLTEWNFSASTSQPTSNQHQPSSYYQQFNDAFSFRGTDSINDYQVSSKNLDHQYRNQSEIELLREEVAKSIDIFDAANKNLFKTINKDLFKTINYYNENYKAMEKALYNHGLQHHAIENIYLFINISRFRGKNGILICNDILSIKDFLEKPVHFELYNPAIGTLTLEAKVEAGVKLSLVIKREVNTSEDVIISRVVKRFEMNRLTDAILQHKKIIESELPSLIRNAGLIQKKILELRQE